MNNRQLSRQAVAAALAGFLSVSAAVAAGGAKGRAMTSEGYGMMTSEQMRREQQILNTVNQVSASGPFQPTWSSLSGYQIPDWYKDAKFGIFIHWGVYSVPAYGSEWYPREMYQQNSYDFKHHVATYGPQDKFGYKDFIPMFKAQKFSPDSWVSLFKDAGAKFIVPVAEHHDGFSMYDNSLSDWNAVKMGPRRDVIGELAVSARKQGLTFGLSSHRAEHWFFFDGGNAFPSDVRDPKYAGLYAPARPNTDVNDMKALGPDAAYMDNWLARTAELVDKYHPQIVWFDWWIGQAQFKPYVQKFAAYYYNRGAQWNKGVAVNYKYDAFPEGAAVLDLERGQLNKIRPLLWQTDTSISNKSWGYIDGDDFKTPEYLVGNLVDIVSKNGVLLLNVGPKSDGTIPDQARTTLRQVGGWLAVNGEAIYGTRPWKTFGEGPTQVADGAFSDTKRETFTGQDFRFTRKADMLYAIALAWPGDHAVIKSLGTNAGLAAGKVTGVTLLGHDGALGFHQSEDGLTVDLPASKPGDYAYALKIVGLELGPATDQSGVTPAQGAK